MLIFADVEFRDDTYTWHTWIDIVIIGEFSIDQLRNLNGRTHGQEDRQNHSSTAIFDFSLHEGDPSMQL